MTMATFLYNSITCHAICGFLTYSRFPRNKKTSDSIYQNRT